MKQPDRTESAEDRSFDAMAGDFKTVYDAGAEAAPLSEAFADIAAMVNGEETSEEREIDRLRAENARLQSELNDSGMREEALFYAMQVKPATDVVTRLQLERHTLRLELGGLKIANARQAETIARLRDKIQWALRYLAGEEGAEPIDAALVLREALKEGT